MTVTSRTLALLTIVWIWTLVSRSHGYPTTPNATHQIQKRQCEWDLGDLEWKCDNRFPTLNELLIRYHDINTGYSGVGPFFFYSGTRINRIEPISYRVVKQYLQVYNLEWYGIFDALDTQWFETQSRHITRNREEFKVHLTPYQRGDSGAWSNPSFVFTGCLSQAFAMSAANVNAYLFIRKGDMWWPSAFWSIFEYPALTQNPNIQRIWRIDPYCDTPDKAELMWQRGRDEPVGPFDWTDWGRNTENTPPDQRWGCLWLLQQDRYGYSLPSPAPAQQEQQLPDAS